MEKSQANNNKFYNDKQYSYETKMMESYLNNFINTKLYLYQFDRVSVEKNLYGEVKKSDKKILPKKELKCMYEIIEEDTEYENGFNYKENLSIKFSVLVKTLKSLNVDINIGDYIRVYDGSEFGDIFFEVTKKHDNNTATKYTNNFRPFVKNYEGVYIRNDVIEQEILKNDFD